jgi:zinc/manganese transport system permease protein
MFAVISMVGGIFIAIGTAVPISPYVTTLSFLIYVICRVVGWTRSQRGWVRRPEVAVGA